MIINGKKLVVLYLENWQKRMVKDFLGVDCDVWEVPIESADVFKYGAPFPPSAHKRMYLTGWQMREIRDEAGITCDFIELTKNVVPMYKAIPPYGVPPK